jgi:apolipoprotein N-acyltransferase
LAIAMARTFHGPEGRDMIGGLPEGTANGIVESVLFSLAMVSGSILLAATVAGFLLFAAGRAQQPWRRRLRIAGTMLGVGTTVAAVAWVFVLIHL